MKKNSISDCKIIELQKIQNRAGNITVVQNFENVSFGVKRIFYIYDIPSGENRGAHAHKECHQFLVSTSGSFSVEMTDGTNKKTIILDRPYYGLHIPPGIWAEEKNFSAGAVCLVLASEKYLESDYIREYKNFKTFKTNENQ